MDDTSFNLYTIFIGNTELTQLLQVAFRTSFMYLYAVLNIRLMDKRSLGMLSPFEFIIIIALGTSVGDPMFYTHVPLIQGMIVISTIVLMERIVSTFAERNKIIEKLLGGSPTMIIKEGKEIRSAMKKQNLTKEELCSALRIRGVKNIGQVEYAYLEPSGSISILLFENPKQDGQSTIKC